MRRLNLTEGHRVRALVYGVGYAIAFISILDTDGALSSFAQSPFGPWLLILVALGLIAFGILSFLEAKWRRTFGGVPA